MSGKRRLTRRVDLRMVGVGVPLAAAFLMLAGTGDAQTPTMICVPEASSKPCFRRTPKANVRHRSKKRQK
jgi:hypothetical protein